MTLAAEFPHLLNFPEEHKFLIDLISIPLFTGIIGYITNWTGVIMLFQPLRFYGTRIPGLKVIWPWLPRRMQVIPAISKDGRFGWQGIIPSRVDKMASIAVDKALIKVGDIRDFYRELEPDKIAEHLTITARAEIREIVDRIMRKEHPQLWGDLPPRLKDAVFERVDAQLPQIIRGITDELGAHIDQLIDAKLMVINYFSSHPEEMNGVLNKMAKKELVFMKRSGLYFGLPLGVIVFFIVHTFPQWWVLPFGGIVIGYLVNYIAVTAVFEPVEPRMIGRFKWQGLFIKRQAEAAEAFADVVAYQVITVERIGDELFNGPRSDRFHLMLETVLEPAADQAIGPLKGAVRVALGSESYDRIRASLASEVSSFGSVFADKDFNAEQSKKIQHFVASQMRELRPTDFAELLRAAIHDDEWLLFLHGAALGLFAGFAHLLLFGV
jgi:uncharacterized membrane protein YheB (UPF0754 family)